MSTDVILRQHEIVKATQVAILQSLPPAAKIADDTVSDVVKLSQALAVQIDKLMTLQAS